MNAIWIVMPILIVLMFLLGIDLDKGAFTGVRRQQKAVLLGILGRLVLLPIIAFGVAWALNLPPVYLWVLCWWHAVLSAALLMNVILLTYVYCIRKKQK